MMCTYSDKTREGGGDGGVVEASRRPRQETAAPTVLQPPCSSFRRYHLSLHQQTADTESRVVLILDIQLAVLCKMTGFMSEQVQVHRKPNRTFVNYVRHKGGWT